MRQSEWLIYPQEGPVYFPNWVLSPLNQIWRFGFAIVMERNSLRVIKEANNLLEKNQYCM